MWFVIAAAALFVIAAGLIVRQRASARRTRPGFSNLSREDQIQVMRNLEGGASRHGDRERAKHYGDSRLGESAGSF